MMEHNNNHREVGMSDTEINEAEWGNVKDDEDRLRVEESIRRETEIEKEVEEGKIGKLTTKSSAFFLISTGVIVVIAVILLNL